MVMGFNLKGNAPPFTNIDDPGIFISRFDEHLPNRIFVLFFGGK